MNPKDLENRLILFTVMIIKIADSLPDTRAANNIASQIVRSCTSPALNYGEAQSAESTNDFVHKIQVVLKELRETFVALRIIQEAEMVKDKDKLNAAISENNELISIFVSTINTIKKKRKDMR
jgi:four helix bundle protein